MIRALLIGASALALGACSLEPPDTRPALPVPMSWPVGDAYLKQSEAALPSVDYRSIFRDARLQSLIEQALANNRDLRIAAANIDVARARYRIQRSERLPQIDAGAGASFTDRGTNSVQGGGAGGGAVNFGGRFDTYSVDLGTTAFEIDLFGRVRSLSRAALDQYFATEAAARATRLTLVGDIADAWLTYAADAALLKVAEQTAASATRSVEITRARLTGGIAPRTDLRQAETILAQAQSDVALARTGLAQDSNALQLLVGAPIDPALLPASLDDAVAAVAELPAGLDSGILLRRPDVVQAEYQLRAANAQIGAARAALFPRISLTAALGFASTALDTLFKDGSFNWSVAPSVSLPIFDFGAARAGVAESRANREALLASYERTIQTAFREVADALARRGTISEQERADRARVEAAADTSRLTDARYRGGIDPFLTSLDAQRSLYAAQRTLIATRLIRMSNLVTLYRTLGGDAQLEVTADGPKPVVATP